MDPWLYDPDRLHSRPQAPDGAVDWPTDSETGELLDDEWLFDGVSRAINAKQYLVLRERREISAVLRRERLYAPGLDGTDQRKEMLRGRDWLEWGDHVDQMIREERFISALTLLAEMIVVAERNWNGIAPPYWYERVGVVLRKMGEYAAEAKYMEEVLLKYPGERFQKRVVRARALQAKASPAA